MEGLMKIKLQDLQENCVPKFKDGVGNTFLRMFEDPLGKVLLGRLEPGASIGLHSHDTSSEVILILSGKGKALYNGSMETLEVGDCHYCPRGQSHSLINQGEEELVFFAVVPEQ